MGLQPQDDRGNAQGPRAEGHCGAGIGPNSPARPQLLYLTQELPLASDAGHKIRSRQLIRGFARTFDVTVAGFVDSTSRPGEATRDASDFRMIAEPAPVRIRRDPVRLARAVMASILTGQPYSISKFSSARLRQRLDAYARTHSPAIVVSNLAMSPYLDLFPRSLQILDSHNVEAALWRDFVEAAPAWGRAFIGREARLLGRLERAAWAGSAGVIAICREDADCIAAEVDEARVLVAPPALAPIGAPTSSVRPRADVGMLGVWSWAPNEHALEVFIEHMAPRLRENSVSMRVVGPGLAAKTRRRLERLGVEVTGRIPDVAEFYGSVDQVLAPYFHGGGVRLKVLEAIAHGVPIVGTPLAFRGIIAGDGAELDPSPDADGLVDRLLARRGRLGDARSSAARLRRKVQGAHDAERVGADLARFLAERLAARTEPRA